MLVIGLGSDGHTVANLRRTPELVLNLVDETNWEKIELLGAMTGANSVPETKRKGTHAVSNKFDAVQWRALQSETVTPDRVVELPVHLEAKVTAIHDEPDGFSVVHARCSRVHIVEDLTIPHTSYVNPSAWHPLIYNFRHYYGLGRGLGIAERADVRTSKVSSTAARGVDL
jgi:flavin reductase (DIM6/NTAB) family NADH-FMN oxidoreductase RutF